MIEVSQYLLNRRTEYHNMYISLVTQYCYFYQTFEVRVFLISLKSIKIKEATQTQNTDIVVLK